MRVFVLCTGRTASTAFSKSCAHLDGFTSGHETRSRVVGYERTDYPDNHIEVDNRLSWFLGTLDKKYGDEAYYVKLNRSMDLVSNSYLKRWFLSISIVRAFLVGVLMTDSYTKKERRAACDLYCSTVEDNIDFFLKDKSKVFEFEISGAEAEFKRFCSWLEIECPKSSIDEWLVPHNLNKTTNYFFKLLKIPFFCYKKIKSALL